MPVFASVCLDKKSRELATVWNELRRDIKNELKDFRNSLESNLRKKLGGLRQSMNYINQAYEEMRNQLSAALTKNKVKKYKRKAR